ncbi:PepSY-associated TM helix domain-containing protein [Bradyrhizobium sp. WSM1743]|uniref:PepSY-associated TM helix domain-containing protein n=1 Tax=Bradyrhizobium sp. WSM1743 TaxID=318996 RepID=UPI000404CA97|nr:PepSY-associated TM helix domain-containing protein [Bradyrhizobium sp. WSM1743]
MLDLPAPAVADEAARRSRARRAFFLRWLRRVHVWLGLWGAVLGLCFGATGILLNHRATLKLPLAETTRSNFQLALPAERPETIEAFAAWAQYSLSLSRPATGTTIEAAQNVLWGDSAIRQPERWQVRFNAPRYLIQVEYWRGNSFASVLRYDANVFATLTRLHKSEGVGVAWILLADSIAGSIILLAVSGLLMWSQLRGGRLAILLVVASAALTLVIGWQSL